LTTHLFVTDTHAHPEFNNKRADYLGKLIADVKPDVVIHGGDSADMPSLSSYDRGKKSFEGRRYKKDVEAHLDFHDRMFHWIKKTKKKQPMFVFLEGNHEHRIAKTINLQPEMEGVISYNDLQLNRWYDLIVPYKNGTPGVINLDGVNYAHFFVSGVMGRPVAGEHGAYSLIQKQLASCSAGHVHTADYAIRTSSDGTKIHGLVAGCYFDYDSDWAGDANRLYWRGLVLKKNVSDGEYDPQFISLKALKKEYQ
jgi:hypothetical protein